MLANRAHTLAVDSTVWMNRQTDGGCVSVCLCLTLCMARREEGQEKEEDQVLQKTIDSTDLN